MKKTKIIGAVLIASITAMTVFSNGSFLYAQENTIASIDIIDKTEPIADIEENNSIVEEETKTVEEKAEASLEKEKVKSDVPYTLGSDIASEIADQKNLQANNRLSGNCGAENNETNVTWELEQNNSDSSNPTYTLTISGAGDMKDFTNGTQPWYNFQNSITKLKIDNGITHIGSHSFRGTKISNIKIPDSVRTIGDYAFIQNKNLVSITASDIKGRNFKVEDDTIFTSYITKNDKEGWELSYFPIAKYTNKYTVPQFVTSIGANSMQMAIFKEVIIETPCSINSYAFAGNDMLEKVVLPDMITFGTEGLNIGSGFNGTFAGCTRLMTIENFVNANIIEIGESVFNQTNVTNLIIPASVVKISGNAFSNPSSYVSVIFEEGSQLNTVEKSAFTKDQFKAQFAENDIKAYLAFVSSGFKANLGDKKLPTSEIFVYEWSGNNTVSIVGITDKGKNKDIITIPGEAEGYPITQIADFVFQNDTNVETIIFENGVPINVGENAFFGCTNLSTFDAGIRQISLDNNALGNNPKLSSVYIPNALELGSKIFSMSNNITLLLINGTVKTQEDSLYKSNADSLVMNSGAFYVLGQTADMVNQFDTIVSEKEDVKLSKIVFGENGIFPDKTDFKKNILATPKRDRYIFKGWYDNDKFNGFPVTSPQAGKNYYAKWEKSNYTVVDKVDFGSLDYGNLSSKNINVKFENETDIVSSVISSDEEIFTVKIDDSNKNNIIITPNKDLTVGTYNEQIVVTTKDGANHIVEVSLAVEKAEPAYEIPSDLTATYGEKLSDITIPAADNGTFTWNNPNEEVGNVGSKSFKATFTPKDTNNYKTVELEIPVTVTKAVPSYEIPSNLSAVEGQTLADVVLPNGFTWQDVTTTPVGSYGINSFFVTFTPEDTTNYEVVKNIPVQIVVNPKMETINTMPEIIANDVTLTVGDEFDPLANVTAKDAEDGEIALTKENIVSNDVDTSKAGTYHVTYKVTDSQGASTEITITVTVEDKGTEKPDVPTTPEKPSDPDISDKPADTNTTEKTDDSKTPVKANTSTEESKAPETGKESNMMLYGWGLLLSALGISGIVFAKRRRSR